MEVAENKDDLVDHTRFVIGMNQVLMYIFVLAYFSLYTKPRRTKRQIRAVAIGLPLWLILSILAGLMNFILYGRSHCKDKSYGSAAIISTIALLVVTLMTLLGSLLIFFKNSGGDNKARVTHAEERDSLVANPELPAGHSVVTVAPYLTRSQTTLASEFLGHTSDPRISQPLSVTSAN